MLNRPRQTASWYRYVLGAGAVIALTAVGAAAMWTGWLPSRPLQWNDINGRLNLGDTGAAIRGEQPIVVNQWPSAGALGYQARGEGLAFGNSNAAPFAERFARREDHDGDRGSAGWGANSKSRLAGTSGRSNGGGGIGGSGGLGTGGGGGAQAPKKGSASEPKAASAARPSSPAPSGSPGRAPAPASPAAGTPATVADIATGFPVGAVPTSLPEFGPTGDPHPGPGPGPERIPRPSAPPMAATPEPASIMLIGTGFLAVAGMIRRRRK